MPKQTATKNPAAIYLSKWPAGSDTRKAMRGALDRIVRLLDPKATAETYPWHKIRYEAAVAVSAKLLDAGLSPRTINQALSALRGVLEAAWRSGQIPDAAYRKIQVKNLGGDSEPAGRALSPEEQAKLREALPKVSARDAALIAVLRACGLRRVEVARLKRESYDPHRGAIRAHGKRNKLRTIPVGEDWRPWVEAHWRAVAPGAALFSSEKGGRPITRRGVSSVVERFAAAAQISCTPHDLRRSFATSLLEAGVDLKTVRDLMGHASLDTTAIYDKRGDERMRLAVEKIQ